MYVLLFLSRVVISKFMHIFVKTIMLHVIFFQNTYLFSPFRFAAEERAFWFGDVGNRLMSNIKQVVFSSRPYCCRCRCVWEMRFSCGRLYSAQRAGVLSREGVRRSAWLFFCRDLVALVLIYFRFSFRVSVLLVVRFPSYNKFCVRTILRIEIALVRASVFRF